MTTEPLSENAKLDEFISELVLLREGCGSPSLRDLETSSLRVVAHHKQEHPNLRPLSVTALSDHLKRRRKQPPTWGWVATYVLACQDYARTSAARVDDPGTATLGEWHDRYRAARAASFPPPIASATGETPLAAPVGPGPGMAGSSDQPRDGSGTWAVADGSPQDGGSGFRREALDVGVPPYGALSYGVQLDDAELRSWMESLLLAEPQAQVRGSGEAPPSL